MQVGDASDDLSLQASLCQESIDWCIRFLSKFIWKDSWNDLYREKRTFLKQRLQARMADLCLKLNKVSNTIICIYTFIPVQRSSFNCCKVNSRGCCVFQLTITCAQYYRLNDSMISCWWLKFFSLKVGCIRFLLHI